MLQHIYAGAAFLGLWLFIAVLALFVLRISLKMDKGDLDGPRQHGL